MLFDMVFGLGAQTPDLALAPAEAAQNTGLDM